MKWHLTVAVNHKKSFKPIRHKDELITIGSCFSEHIGQHLENAMFNVVQNPFGILYNPQSIQKALQRILDKQLYKNEEIAFENGRYFSFDHHTSFSSTNKEVVVANINNALVAAHHHLKTASTIIITFGTVFYYKLSANDEVVGNCHKLPAKQFSLHRDSSANIQQSFNQILQKLKQLNKNIQVIFTVSPVRHWKNGAADNNWSKAILIDAVRCFSEYNDNVHYFPSYEIMMDELRDYRFYNEDMLHPNKQAIDVIWDRFLNNSVEKNDLVLVDKINQIKKAVQHKPFDFESEEHQVFIASTLKKIEKLQQQYQYLNFETDIKLLKTPK